MAVKSTFGHGGGQKFNNCDGVIKDYIYATRNPFAKGEPKQLGDNDFHPLYAVLTARMDGKPADDVDVMLVGDARDFKIENNGRCVVPVKKGGKVWDQSQWGKFIESWEEVSTLGAQTEPGEPTYVEDGFSYEAILGTRVRFGQVPQFDKAGNIKTRKGSDGKTYNDTITVVTAYYGKTDVAVKTATTTKAASKPNGKAVEVSDGAQRDEALKGLLTVAGGKMPKSFIASAKSQLYLKKTFGVEAADVIRRDLYDDEYLADAVDRGVISRFDLTAKEMTITA